MNGFLQDLRFGIRGLRKTPGLTAVAVLSLGLGIGATATVFTWLNGMVLNPLPAVPEWDRVVAAYTRPPEGGDPWPVSWPDFRDWREGARGVDLAAYEMMQVGLRDSGATERAWATLVSGNYFEMLRVPAALGRVIGGEDERQRLPVAVLGHGFWERRFAGDSSVIGRTVTLNGSAFTIVGVAAPRFRGTYIGLNYNLYVPATTVPLIVADGGQMLEDRRRRAFGVVGRLRSGVGLPQAVAELDAVALRAGQSGGLAQPLGAVVKYHRDVDAPGVMRPLLSALLAVAGLVLLIACANVANLLLARAVARRREVAVRLAVGASRLRLVRQLLTESLTLATLAGLVGLMASFWGRDAMLALLPPVPFPVGLNFEMEPSVVLFATLATTGAALVFGLAPALQSSRPDLVPALKDEIGEGSGGRGRLQGALVVMQVALSLVTLVTAGLFVRSLAEYRSIDSGLKDLDRVLLVGTDLRLSGIRGDSLGVSVARSLLERVRGVAGVEAATLSRAVLLGPGPLNTADIRVEGYTPRPDEDMSVTNNDVAGGYLRTLGIRVLEGRELTDADMAGGAPVVVVNEAFARRFLSGRPALGARIDPGGGRWASVVGVAATTKVNDYTEDPKPVVFRPYSPAYAPPSFTLQVKAAGDPLALVPAVRTAFNEVSAELPFLDPRSMAEYTTIPYWPSKVGAVMLSAVGALALLLATIGIYASMAYAVSRRVREIGVRLALGAARKQVVGMIVARAMRMTVVGLLIGLAGALAVGQALRSQLLGISPRDPFTLAGVGLVLAAAALAAAAVPARRAAHVDPMIAMRSE